MAAVTENQLIVRQEGCKQEYPVAASTTIYQGTLCFSNLTGYLDDDTATGVNRFAGIATEKKDNSSGSAGDLKTEDWTSGDFELNGTFTQASVGRDAYAINNNDVVVVPTAASVRIGKVKRYVSATRAVIGIEAGEESSSVPSVAIKTGDYTVLAGDSGRAFETTGASATVTFTLPAATPGLNYRFRVGAVQELRIDPDGTETISLPSNGVPGAAGKYLTANAVGETVELMCLAAGTWSVFGFTGTWTAEA